jgi:shikimate kinase
MQDRIVLIGFMGCGKTTVGKNLAQKKDSLFIDTDHWIEKKENKSISDIFEQYGEDYFRRLETKCLQILGENKNKMVLSTGGGMVLRKENILLMQKIGPIIYLKTSPEVLLQRLDSDTTRPLLQGLETEAKLKKIKDILKVRTEIYETAADIIIHTDHKSIDAIIEDIERCL